MKVLRFLVRVDAAWNVVVTCPLDPTFTRARAMRKATWRRRSFPLPPETEALAVPGDAARKALFADATGTLAAQHHDRIAQREPRSGDIERFGYLLFLALLGPTLWADLLACADRIAGEGAGLIELALGWDAADADLNRLNWELMRSETGFLARGAAKRVTITRIVASPATGTLALGTTPRVLFVAGSKLSDGKIRPLAEYLSFLQALRPQRDVFGAGPRGWQSEIVLDATPRRLREAVVRFEPDVVHFVCHGAIQGGKTVLELQPDAEGSGYRSADQIVDLITRGAVLPSVVVLSACYSGTSEDDLLPREVVTEQHTGPFAAQIVARGVPIVVGMAGRIADSACRLFTRRFSEALIAGEPIVLAVEEGRRAAFSQGDPPDSSADWAFPTLFLADSVPPDIQTSPPPAGIRLTESWLDAYGLSAIAPVFCGRFELLEAFNTALSDPGHRVLAAYTEKDTGTNKYGKTHLLKELTVRALTSGHIPCLMTWIPGQQDPPRNLRALLQAIGAAILSAREALSVPSPGPEQIPLLLDPTKSLDQVARDPDLASGIRKRIASDRALSPGALSLSPQVVRLAVEHDLGLLITDARAAHPTIVRAPSRALLLFDDVDDYGDALDPLLRTVIGNSGLGTPSEPFPVVLTFLYGGPQKEGLKEVYERKKGAWMVHALNEFSTGEDLLAYERLLMNPLDDPRAAPQSAVPRAFNYRLDADQTARGERGFRRFLKGIPSLATSTLFHDVADQAQEDGFVVSADDDAILRGLRKAPA
ncbi:MAG: CHAT domain-containing protein [Byssovorax sp.]